MKDHVAVLVAWPWLGGAYLQDKSTCARTSTENVGGAYTPRGSYVRDATVLAGAHPPLCLPSDKP